MTIRQLLVAAAAVLLLVAVVVRLDRRGGASPGAVLADPVRTPGVLNPDVTPATLRSTVCRHGWTRTIRPPVEYTDGLKRAQMRAYHETGPPSAYQEDHLISLELGGDPADPRNLWPEPIAIAEQVDQVENDLNRKICTGEITLAEGQRRISELKHTSG